MKAPEKPDKPKGERSEYERFEALTKALVSVPKAELLAEKHEKAKKKVRRSA